MALEKGKMVDMGSKIGSDVRDESAMNVMEDLIRGLGIK